MQHVFIYLFASSVVEKLTECVRYVDKLGSLKRYLRLDQILHLYSSNCDSYGVGKGK